MMLLTERINVFERIFEELQSTNSLNEKREIVGTIPDELRNDFYFCLEVLSGKYKLGYTYYDTGRFCELKSSPIESFTIQQVYEFLQLPLKQGDLSRSNIYLYLCQTQKWSDFLEPLCNREFKLGIGQSLLSKNNTSPMLAKRFEGKLPFSNKGYFITEKLDGNRCIAWFDGNVWRFQSRNGKPMNVDFDMGDLDTTLIYDEEILSKEQVELSNDILNYVKFNMKSVPKSSTFNETSGIINRKDKHNKNLIYNIFDIVNEHMTYYERRQELRKLSFNSKYGDDVRFLPLLCYFDKSLELEEVIPDVLGRVTELGGEGVMINVGSFVYQQKRTQGLLKYKDVQTIDMKVINTYPGTGKYLGLVGAIQCELVTNDKIILVKVGSGLSDKQREEWLDDKKIVGKIVEVEYFSLSQNSGQKGSNVYSLRFPRLKKVREDKVETSEN